MLGVWGMGDIMIIFLAALLDVPIEQYEAADLDGAGPVQQFRYITLPNISPVLLFAAVTGVIDALQYFTQAAVASALASGVATTGGGIASSLGYPDGVDAHLPAVALRDGLPELLPRLRLRDGGRAVRRRLVFVSFLLRRFGAFLGTEDLR